MASTERPQQVDPVEKARIKVMSTALSPSSRPIDIANAVSDLIDAVRNDCNSVSVSDNQLSPLEERLEIADKDLAHQHSQRRTTRAKSVSAIRSTAFSV